MQSWVTQRAIRTRPHPFAWGCNAQSRGRAAYLVAGQSSARIVHLEDEPSIAFDQIVAAGLRLGQKIRILEISPERYILSDGEVEYRLAPTVAANVCVAALPESEMLKASAIPLNELTDDQRAEIITLDRLVQGSPPPLPGSRPYTGNCYLSRASQFLW